MAWNVLAHNGVLQLHDPGPAVTFLRSQLPGVYTTTRSTNNASSLFLWDRHLERLAQSLNILAHEIPQIFPNDAARIVNVNDFVKDLLQPSLKVGLEKAMEVRKDGEELLLTAYLCGSVLTDRIWESEKPKEPYDKEHNGFDVYVHVSRCMPEHIECAQNVAHLAVMGPGRIIPTAKHSEWVRTRQALEHFRPKDVTEIILSNDGDLLLEGMVTNFFVRMGSSVEGNEVSTENEAKKSIVVQTAPLKGVLPGVLRQLIAEVCAEQGISFEEISPSWRNRGLWKEAFISNSVRFVQSVGSIQCPREWGSICEPQNWQKKSWEHLILQAPGHFTRSIQDLVWNRALIYSVSIDSLLTD